MAAKTGTRRGWNKRSWLNLRKAIQVLAFAGFILLFLNASHELMRLDPLAMLASLISSRTFDHYLLMALFMVVLAFVFGRAWCSWLCPLGSMLDWLSFNKWRPVHKQLPDGLRSVKYVILIAIIAAAAFSNLTLLVLDPLTIMVRTFAAAVWPGLDTIISWIEAALNNIPFLQGPVSTLDNALRPLLLPTDQLIYRDGWLFGLILIVIIGLNLVAERFWCRYLCPLGAFYGAISKISLIRRRVDTSCIKCKLCEQACPTGTIDRKKDCSSDPGECIMCLNCMECCQCSTSDFGTVRTPAVWNSYDPGRRQLFIGLGAAAVLAILFRFAPLARTSNQYLIRPPGSTEDDMLSRCIRCGECIKACPTAAIQPALYEAGAEAFWTPVIVPRVGFCQYSCNACGKACPVEAIPHLSLDEKRLTTIGWAVIDISRCLPWTENTPCIVCEEMCPVPHKAITLRRSITKDSSGNRVELLQPVVHKNRCIGCGLCEYKCPVEGQAAIRVRI